MGEQESINPDREAEAFLRIANCIATESPSVTNPHWHEALTEIRARLGNAARRSTVRGRPAFGLIDGGED